MIRVADPEAFGAVLSRDVASDPVAAKTTLDRAFERRPQAADGVPVVLAGVGADAGRVPPASAPRPSALGRGAGARASRSSRGIVARLGTAGALAAMPAAAWAGGWETVSMIAAGALGGVVVGAVGGLALAVAYALITMALGRRGKGPGATGGVFVTAPLGAILGAIILPHLLPAWGVGVAAAWKIIGGLTAGSAAGLWGTLYLEDHFGLFVKDTTAVVLRVLAILGLSAIGTVLFIPSAWAAGATWALGTVSWGQLLAYTTAGLGGLMGAWTMAAMWRQRPEPLGNIMMDALAMLWFPFLGIAVASGLAVPAAALLSGAGAAAWSAPVTLLYAALGLEAGRSYASAGRAKPLTYKEIGQALVAVILGVGSFIVAAALGAALGYGVSALPLRL